MSFYRNRPEKRIRARIDRLASPTRSMPARRFVVHPDPKLPFVVEVRIARNRRHMREEMRRLDRTTTELECQGLVRSWHSKLSGQPAVRPGGMVARMYLNVCDLRRRPSEIVAHECAHAALAWGRHRRADLRQMPGEEVVCYAAGQLVRQINHYCFAFGVWR